MATTTPEVPEISGFPETEWQRAASLELLQAALEGWMVETTTGVRYSNRDIRDRLLELYTLLTGTPPKETLDEVLSSM